MEFFGIAKTCAKRVQNVYKTCTNSMSNVVVLWCLFDPIAYVIYTFLLR